MGALERSVSVMKTQWQRDEQRWPKTATFTYKRHLNHPLRIAISIAAIIALVLTLSIMWHQEKGVSTNASLTLARIELEVERSAVAAQFLAVADLLAQQPGGEQYAVDRYKYIINNFPKMQEHDLAQTRLQTLNQRRTIP
jgi:hypothetical protein